MAWAAVVGAGISLAGGIIGNKAAGDAADAANQGVQDGITEIKNAGEQVRKDTAPYRTLGAGSANTLSYLLGITDGAPKTRDQIYQELLPQYTLSNMGIVDPRNTNGVADIELKKAVDDAMQYNIGANKNAGAAGSLLKQFDQADLDKDLVYQNGLQFGLDNGNKAIENRARALGGSDSGQTLKALSAFGNDYATTKTEGAYNRNMGEKSSIYNMLMGGTGVGQNAVNTTATTGMNLATALSGANSAMGRNNAAGISGGANAITGALGGIGEAVGGLF